MLQIPNNVPFLDDQPTGLCKPCCPGLQHGAAALRPCKVLKVLLLAAPHKQPRIVYMRRGAVCGTDVELKKHPPSTPHMHGSAPHACSPPQEVHLVHLVCVSCAKAPRRHIYHTQNSFLTCSVLNQEPFSSHVRNKCRISLNPICFECFYCWDC